MAEDLKYQLEKARKETIARIEYPALAHKVAVAMKKKGIPYLFKTVRSKNILTVRIVEEYFFEIPLTMRNADKVLGLMNYILHRPEYAHEEIPGIRKKFNYPLAQKWDDVASLGEDD